ncbi:MAG TPA: peptide chain release factor N(5)-glutamine methyltransferase [Blastocatellia bacterium]|nr:peptide chain release factor N(5)-glutamine methyltransferase [Blastocatellia bacterium]
MPTIAEAIAQGAGRLRAAGVDDERRTASLLLCHALGVERTYLLSRPSEQVVEVRFQAYLEMVGRRASGEPSQYITGHQEFYGLDFNVTRAVLIPRPETEFLVEWVIERARECSRPGAAGGPLIVDAGTGSGCIAVALSAHIPEARVVATDISGAALDVARSNAARHGVGPRVEFLRGDLLGPLSGRGLEGRVDLIASNPPYIPDRERQSLQREVRDWEPEGALFAGEDGLLFYRRLLSDAPRYLKPGGCLACEIGYGQLAPIREMIDPALWRLQDVRQDLQSIPRVVALLKL